MVVLAFGALWLASSLLSARALPEASTLERTCGSVVLLVGISIGIVYVLGALHAIATLPWLMSVLAVLLLAAGASGLEARTQVIADALAVSRAARRVSWIELAALGVGAVAVGLAAFSTYLLEPWAWDSLGYHLPIVHDALQTGTLRAVPTSVIYVNCYPRLVDVFFIAWRLSLGGETWIELGQLPLAIGGVLAIAAIAERAGVPARRGIALGALWLALPVTMLVLAAAYVDVAVAGLTLLTFVFATSRVRAGNLAIAGVAIGLLLGSKPSAPPIAGLAMLVMLVRGAREGRALDAAVAAVIAMGIGIWKYVENSVLWHNPIWPAHVRIAGIDLLPGKASMSELAESGLREPYLSMSLPWRVLASWTAIPEGYVFDMRIGGFGPLFTFALLPMLIAVPVASCFDRHVRARARSIALPVALIVGSVLASPGAFWARYTLALPAAALALSISLIQGLPKPARFGADLAAIGLAALGSLFSWRGLTEDGPSVFEIAAMSPEDRVAAYAVDGQERDWQRARARVGPGEAFGYDWSYGLPGRLWPAHGRGRIAFLPITTPTQTQLEAWIESHRVRVVVLGEGPTGAADLARAHPERFRELFRSAYPEWQPSAVFEVLPRSPARSPTR